MLLPGHQMRPIVEMSKQSETPFLTQIDFDCKSNWTLSLNCRTIMGRARFADRWRAQLHMPITPVFLPHKLVDRSPTVELLGRGVLASSGPTAYPLAEAAELPYRYAQKSQRERLQHRGLFWLG